VKNKVGRDCIAEAEVAGENGVAGAKECVVWMLMNCKGVEDMEGGAKEEEGEAANGKVETDVEGKGGENGEKDGVVNGDRSVKEKEET